MLSRPLRCPRACPLNTILLTLRSAAWLSHNSLPAAKKAREEARRDMNEKVRSPHERLLTAAEGYMELGMYTHALASLEQIEGPEAA